METMNDRDYYAYKDAIERAARDRNKEFLKQLRYEIMSKYYDNRDRQYILDLISREV